MNDTKIVAWDLLLYYIVSDFEKIRESKGELEVFKLVPSFSFSVEKEKLHELESNNQKQDTKVEEISADVGTLQEPSQEG
jgi:hypothetical protein